MTEIIKCDQCDNLLYFGEESLGACICVRFLPRRQFSRTTETCARAVAMRWPSIPSASTSKGAENMAHDEKIIGELREKADGIRAMCLEQFTSIGQGHVGGTMSMADIAAALYLHHIKFDSEDPDWPERDRVVWSKAHCAEAAYAALTMLGMYDKAQLKQYYGYRSPFQGHADRWCTPGIDFSGGSLGQGLCLLAVAWPWPRSSLRSSVPPAGRRSSSRV